MKPWTFIYAADMQPGSPKSFRFEPAGFENWRTARRQIMALKPEFLLIGGDVTRDGSIHLWELEEMKADFDTMDIPYYLIPGNMDTGNKHTDRRSLYTDRNDLALNITSAHLANWKAIFGDWKWSFTHKNVRVSGFCDMIVNSGLPEEQELWDWLEEQRQQPLMSHHLWLMHYALFLDRVDEPDWDIASKEHYLDWYFTIDQPGRARLMDLFRATGATRVVTGHIHCRKDHVVGDIAFDLAPGIWSSQFVNRWPDADGTLGFFEYTVTDNKMIKRFVPLDVVSTRTDGYGPGGHPLPETRDYSLAWEAGGAPEKKSVK